MYERIVVALDGSPAAERVLPHVEALATAFSSEVTLVRATVSAEMVVAQTAAGDATVGQVAPLVDPDPVVDADRSTADDYLNGVSARLAQRNVKVNVERPEGPADTVIVERAAALGAGLICMTTHGRTGLGRVVFGSVAGAVLRAP